MIASLSYVRKALGDNKAKKKLGQNFLIDGNIVEKIAVNACNLDIDTIEVGPGLGGLSEQLLKYSKRVYAYEIDQDMFQHLSQEIKDERFNLFLQDFLQTDLSVYKDKVNFCANLPYYVTTPILFKLFESEVDFNRITIMIQSEVAQRLLAKANSSEYSALSLEVQYLFEVKKLMNVPRACFYPVPNVDSIVLTLIPIRKRDREYEKSLFDLIRNCFRQRRKTLSNNLNDLYSKERIAALYKELNFNSSIRAQELSLDDFIRMERILNES